MKLVMTLALSLFCYSASAQQTTSGSIEEFGATGNFAATSRSAALTTKSIFYSLPREEMTYLELGTYNQRQTLKSEVNPNDKLSNQAFFFNHARGLNDVAALDFDMDYFVRDENSSQSTGVHRAMAGLRSNAEAMDVTWVFGGHLIYLPQGELREDRSKLAASFRAGFEENVDIARWGIEAEATTENSALYDDAFNLIGFFEMPFVRRMDLGVTAGADLTRLAASQANHFAKIYGQFAIDPVSAAQLSLRQRNVKDDNTSLAEAEIGLSVNRVF